MTDWDDPRVEMDLLDQFELLGAQVEAGEIRYEDAVQQLAEWNSGTLTPAGAHSWLQDWALHSGRRHRPQSSEKDQVKALPTNLLIRMRSHNALRSPGMPIFSRGDEQPRCGPGSLGWWELITHSYFSPGDVDPSGGPWSEVAGAKERIRRRHTAPKVT
jgi:hypothetical protein